jgi:mannosyltransferase OCH1-like enzyme
LPFLFRKAYNEKKYSLVADYIRIKAIYEEGGIYLDMDVEVYKNFDVLLL